MNDQLREQLLDYVLGELEPKGRAAVEQLAAQDSSVGLQLEELRRVATLLSDMPAEAWAGVPDAVEAPPTSSSSSYGRARRRRHSWQRRAAAVAAGLLLLGAGFGIGSAVEHRSTAYAGRTVVLRALGSRAGGAAVAHTRNGRLTLDVRKLPTLAGSRFYELWLMNDSKSLVALASFRVRANGTAQLEVPLPVSAALFHYLDISVQSIGAGPLHSADSVLRGALPGSGEPLS